MIKKEKKVPALLIMEEKQSVILLLQIRVILRCGVKGQ